MAGGGIGLGATSVTRDLGVSGHFGGAQARSDDTWSDHANWY